MLKLKLKITKNIKSYKDINIKKIYVSIKYKHWYENLKNSKNFIFVNVDARNIILIIK